MILDTLVEATRARITAQMAALPTVELRRQAEELARKKNRKEFLFEKTLAGKNEGTDDSLHFICEVKKASPSKGLIAPDFPHVQIAKEYEAAGADCISVLTETDYFLGSDDYFREIRPQVSIPMLRKDFTIDPYMVYQAKTMGADCVLLICAILAESELKDYMALCDSLGLTALVETHDEREVQMAVRAGARVLGVNNRNLKTFEVDLRTSERLRRLVPENILFVAESGIRDAQDIALLRQTGVNGVLIGETLMRSPDKKRMLARLRGNGESHA